VKLLVDMNLSPDWVGLLRGAGWEAAHWGDLGDPRATDAEIFGFAGKQGWGVFTHDLRRSLAMIERT
jgi:predicted nuclease of predicted toxin-antitoxin system